MKPTAAAASRSKAHDLWQYLPLLLPVQRSQKINNGTRTYSTIVPTVIAAAVAAIDFMRRRLRHLLRGSDADARAAQVRLELEEQREAADLQQQYRAILLAAE